MTKEINAPTDKESRGGLKPPLRPREFDKSTARQISFEKGTSITSSGIPPEKDTTVANERTSQRRRSITGRKRAAWKLALQIAVLSTVFILRKPEGKPAQQDTIPAQEEITAREDAETVFCDSDNATEGSTTPQNCTVCPENAECKDGKLSCLPGYTNSQENKSSKTKETSLQTCTEDLASKAKAEEVLKILMEVLKERQGRYECGLPLDPLFSPSEQLGGKPWSNAIKQMCSGPGLTRWQMHFHPEIAPAIAHEGVYFWLFYHFLGPEAADELNIQVGKKLIEEGQIYTLKEFAVCIRPRKTFSKVERQYLFVPLANPVDFPGLHERLMKEQSRSKGITFTYTYKGSDLRKPLSCRISQLAQEHFLALLMMLSLLVVTGHFAQHFYLKHYIRKEVLKLIRLHSQQAGDTAVSRGIPTESIYNLLCHRVARGGTIPRLLLRNRLTVELVEDACQELLWNPETGVHSYRLHESNHWWAEDTTSSFPAESEAAEENKQSVWNSIGPTVGMAQNSEAANSPSLGAHIPQWERESPHTRESGSNPLYSWRYGDSPPRGHLWKQDSLDSAADYFATSNAGECCLPFLCAENVQRMAIKMYENGASEGMKPAKGLDDYLGLMRELRELRRASHAISGELSRDRHLRSPNM